MARRSGLIRQSPIRSRRVAKWGVGPRGVPIAVTSGTPVVGTGVVLTTEAQVTIVRIRGYLQAFLTSAAAAFDGFDGAIGFGLVSDEAFAIGQTALPSPRSDSDWDGWMYHRYLSVHSLSTTIASEGRPGNVDFEIDSKAMRKWSEGYTLAPIVEFVENGTATMEIWFDSRMLLKLS